jgi:hypothetical protein
MTYFPKTGIIKKIETKSHLDASVSTQIIDHNDQDDVNGTEVSYTPEAGASYVIYEYIIQYHNDQNSSSARHNHLYFELWSNEGSGYSSLGQGYKHAQSGYYNEYQDIITGYFKLNPWSGSKSLKLRCRARSNETGATLHENEGSNHFDPIITIYSII